jgi:ketosteroid isomerase-like protein
MEVMEQFYRSNVNGMVSLVSEDAVFVEAVGVPYTGTYKGREGVRELMRRITGPFKIDFQGKTRLFDAGENRVVAHIFPKMTSRRTGISVELEAIELYEVEDGLITSTNIFYKDPGALAALMRVDQVALA